MHVCGVLLLVYWIRHNILILCRTSDALLNNILCIDILLIHTMADYQHIGQPVTHWRGVMSISGSLWHIGEVLWVYRAACDILARCYAYIGQPVTYWKVVISISGSSWHIGYLLWVYRAACDILASCYEYIEQLEHIG